MRKLTANLLALSIAIPTLIFPLSATMSANKLCLP